MNKLLTCIEDVICFATNRFAVIITVVLFTLGAKATDRVIISGLAYEIDKTEKVATLVRQDKELQGDIVVPGSVIYEKVNYPVKLSHAAFGECAEITSVSLQCNAMFLPDYIFSGCSKLRNVELPIDLQIMGNGCCMNCKMLSAIKLPSTLYGIGSQCFWGCWSLKDVELPEGMLAVGAGGFAFCYSLEEIEFPNKVHTIGDQCFHQCLSLKSIVLSNSKLASSKCTSLYDMDYNNVKLQVPEGTAQEYCKSIAWQNFDIIENTAMDIEHADKVDELVDVYSIRGIKVKSNVPIASLRNFLSPDIYIVKGKKVIVK